MKKNSNLALANDQSTLLISNAQGTNTYDITGDGVSIGIFEGELTIVENQTSKSIDPLNTIELDLVIAQGKRNLKFLPGRDINNDEVDSLIVISTDMIGSLTDGESFLTQLPQSNATWNNLTVDKEVVNLTKGNYVIKVDSTGEKLTIALVNAST